MSPNRPEPPFPKQKQSMPGRTAAMKPVPDHGEDTYKGSGRLKDKKAIITAATQSPRMAAKAAAPVCA
jgi:hypothetical protein